MVTGLNDEEGASPGEPVDRASATGPAWPIWAAAAAPSPWIASVSRRRPGTTSSCSQRHPEAVRPSGATAR